MFSLTNFVKPLVAAAVAGILYFNPMGVPEKFSRQLINKIRQEQIKLLDFDWGCPSVFNPNACKEYNSSFYK